MLAPCPFSGEKVLGALGKIPSDSFLTDSAEVQAKWLHFVASVDADPKSLHDVMFYAIVARTLAEVMGSAQPADYAEPHMRSLIVDGIKVGAAPFVRNLRMLRQHGRDVNCCLVELVNHHLFQPRVHRRSQCCKHRCVHRRRNGSRSRAESCV